jgi:hypothetical protein
MSFNINSAIQSHTAVLTGIKNYSQWSRQVHALLTMAGWWSIIEGISTHAGQADAAAQATWIAKTGVSVQPWCGREAYHEGKVRRGCVHVSGMRRTCGRLRTMCDR